MVDEDSQVPLSMWSALLNLKFTGNIVIVAGDMDGQIQPIADRNRLHKLNGFDRSQFMHDLCEGFRVELHKYRRGDDAAHFEFVGSIYPKYKISLEDALKAARKRYPCKGCVFLGTTLCISHKCRIRTNAEVNTRLARSDSVFVKAGAVGNGMANQPQDMRVWKGIVLMAVCKSQDKEVKNGIRYRVMGIEGDEAGKETFTLAKCDDDDVPVAEPFRMSAVDLGNKMRLTHALCYFSSQARTIKNGLRLVQTRSNRMTLRYLITGLGRAPCGDAVQVE